MEPQNMIRDFFRSDQAEEFLAKGIHLNTVFKEMTQKSTEPQGCRTGNSSTRAGAASVQKSGIWMLSRYIPSGTSSGT